MERPTERFGLGLNGFASPALRSIAAAVALLILLTASGIVPAVAAWSSNSYVPPSERDLIARINAVRSTEGLTTLRPAGVLTRTARWRSEDMGRQGYFSHQIPPGGRDVFSVLEERGYCYMSAGETIGWNTDAENVATARVLDQFLSSPAHRAILLSDTWTVVGAGAWRTDAGRTIWTVLFAKPCR